MSNSLIFHDVTFDVRTIHNITYITSVQLAQALGYANENAVAKIYNRNADEFTEEMTCLPKLCKQGVRLFSLRGAHLVAMFARTPVAKEFRKWVLDVLDKEARADVNLLQPDYFTKVRNIAIKFADDLVRVGKGEDVPPILNIPDDVLAGIVAQQLNRQSFALRIDYEGKLHVKPMPDPYEGIAEAIADPGNIGLENETIEKVMRACVDALTRRLKKSKHNRAI